MKLYFLLLFLSILLAVRFIYFFQHQKSFQDGEIVSFAARLVQEPEQKGRVQEFVLQPDGYEPVYISVPLFPEYHYADILQVSGKIKLSEGEKHTFVTMNYPKVRVEENDSLLYGLIGFIREKVARVYTRALPATSASLLMGVVFGIKSGMPEEFKDALSATGVTHVIAASGMNVTMVAGAFTLILGAFFKRQAALILSIVGIIFYASLAGFEPSIVRASIMGGLVFFSGITGRQNVALWTLGLTGYLMLLWQPGLSSDVGFQLSFLATLGILVIKPVISDFIGALKFPQTGGKMGDGNLVSEDFTTTLAAQLATIPVLLSAFGAVSFLSLLVNMLVLWTIPPLMVIGSAAAILGFIAEPLGQLVVFLSLPFLWYFEWVVTFFAKFHWMLEVESVPWSVVLLYYVFLFGGVFWMRRRSVREVGEIKGRKTTENGNG